MPRNPKPLAENNVEQDFNAAIDRLLDGRPTNRDLVKMAKAGKLKINKASVAAEAGRSRVTLDKYASIIARISAQETKPVTTARDVITRLRETNIEREQQKQAALDAMAAMLLRMRSLEKTTDIEISKALRIAARKDPNKVVGVSNVVQLRGGDDNS
jgi:hypothetical protein